MPTLQIETSSPWDALALAAKLPRYRWYLVEPNAQRWDVCLPVDDPAGGLPTDVRAAVEQWLDERRLDAATIRAGDRTHAVALTYCSELRPPAGPRFTSP
jgi:hypothetical protein